MFLKNSMKVQTIPHFLRTPELHFPTRTSNSQTCMLKFDTKSKCSLVDSCLNLVHSFSFLHVWMTHCCVHLTWKSNLFGWLCALLWCAHVQLNFACIHCQSKMSCMSCLSVGTQLFCGTLITKFAQLKTLSTRLSNHDEIVTDLICPALLLCRQLSCDS